MKNLIILMSILLILISISNIVQTIKYKKLKEESIKIRTQLESYMNDEDIDKYLNRVDKEV